jgi:hypothetical protein
MQERKLAIYFWTVRKIQTEAEVHLGRSYAAVVSRPDNHTLSFPSRH